MGPRESYDHPAMAIGRMLKPAHRETFGIALLIIISMHLKTENRNYKKRKTFVLQWLLLRACLLALLSRNEV